MISYPVYKVLHILGIMSLFFGFACVLVLAMTGQLKTSRARLLGFLTHGVVLFLILVSGFGMAARLQMFGNLPNWVYGKITVWVLLGLAVSLMRRKPNWAFFNLIAILSLGGTAAFFAIYKPF